MKKIKKEKKEEIVNLLLIEKLKRGERVCFLSRGKSMFPFIPDGAVLEIEPVLSFEKIKLGDVVLRMNNQKIFCHRIVKIKDSENGKIFITKGDSVPYEDPLFSSNEIYGKITKIKFKGIEISLNSFYIEFFQKIIAFFSPYIGRFQRIFIK